MPLSYRELSKPAIEPITLTQAKQHLRVDFPDDDTYITSLITGARQHVEKLTNRAIFNRKMLLTLDYFPWPGWGSTTGSTAHDYFMHWYYRGLTIRIPKPATVSVDSLSYLANDGVTVVTIDPSNYRVDLTSEPARIAPTPGYTWPYQQNYIPGQVKVNFTAGTYELPVTESFTVPAEAPYTYTLQQAASLITFNGVTNAEGATIACSNSSGTLTFAASFAGQTLTASYTINNCPETIVWAMYLIIKHLYDHRAAASDENLKTIPLGVDELLAGEVFDSFDL
jgi:Phage gp6-like head-tail connector protein